MSVHEPKAGDHRVVTRGNFSFVQFAVHTARDIATGGDEEKILTVLDQIEKTNPEIEILNWIVQTRYTGVYVYEGIWIHHKPRKPTVTSHSRSDVSSPHDIGNDAG